MEDFFKYAMVIVAVATIFILALVVYRATNNPLDAELFEQSITGKNTEVSAKIEVLCVACQNKKNFDKDCFLLTAKLIEGNVTEQMSKATFDGFLELKEKNTYELKIVNQNEKCVIRILS